MYHCTTLRAQLSNLKSLTTRERVNQLFTEFEEYEQVNDDKDDEDGYVYAYDDEYCDEDVDKERIRTPKNKQRYILQIIRQQKYNLSK